jgi:hypothetical protein
MYPDQSTEINIRIVYILLYPTVLFWYLKIMPQYFFFSAHADIYI